MLESCLFPKSRSVKGEAGALMKGRLVSCGALAAAVLAVRRVARRSGVTAAEVRAPLPGDAVVGRPLWVSTRGVTVEAPPEKVWPWVVQMGYPTERAGWYTPHWLDELMWGERPHSADAIRPELQDLKVGDMVPDSEDWSAKYVVEELEPASHLLLHSTWHVFGPVRSCDFTWVFALRPLDRGATRLLVRARVAWRPLWTYPFIYALLGVGDWANVSVMLRGIKARAERGS